MAAGHRSTSHAKRKGAVTRSSIQAGAAFAPKERVVPLAVEPSTVMRRTSGASACLVTHGSYDPHQERQMNTKTHEERSQPKPKKSCCEEDTSAFEQAEVTE